MGSMVTMGTGIIKREKLFNHFKVGVIGCGMQGSWFIRYLIKIKDSGQMLYKLIVSTRRPYNVDSEILNSIDENVEIILDNERVYIYNNL